jgi:EAL domain-containing protein (putative c-di-GMP-specific phosphodiesterase class I)/CheY-like chemotaxis protein
MPNMTGMALVAAIRRLPLHDRTPVVFVSGDGSAETRIQALQAGANDFMVKPVFLPELVARVEAQVRLSVTWQSTLRGLSRRGATVTALADLGAGRTPAATAAELCERISGAHDGSAVGVYESRGDGTHVLLGSIGPQPVFITTTTEPSLSRLRQWARAGPWVEHERADKTAVGSGTWWACSPLRRNGRSLGLLVLSGPSVRDGADVDQLLAAAVDYASVTALHLGVGLTDALAVRKRREALRRVLVEREFWPVFQPVVDLGDGRVIGYEAFTRFSDGVAPDQRLAEAAEVGMAAEMELAMLVAALERSHALHGEVWLSCNVSPAVLIECNAELAVLMARSRHPLVVELTEHSPIEDYPAARAALARLGPTVRLSVDDAGSGFASLRHVVDLHPQFLKLDRSWVTGIDNDDARQALVAGLVGFSARTGIDMIAEGIETIEEKSTLKQLGVLYGQGYLLGRPEPIADLDHQKRIV